MPKPVILKSTNGFTLIELIVSVAIITVITAIVFFNYKAFNDNLALSSAQQEISISIRQAQIYGLSVKENKIAGSDFNSGYGMYLNKTDQTNYYLFADVQNSINLANDGVYSGTSSCSSGPSPECVEKNTLRNGVKINRICGALFGGSIICPPNNDNNIVSMHITFVRPNPDAKIVFMRSDGTYTGAYKTGQVQLISVGGKTVNVTIENTGQVSVQ